MLAEFRLRFVLRRWGVLEGMWNFAFLLLGRRGRLPYGWDLGLADFGLSCGDEGVPAPSGGGLTFETSSTSATFLPVGAGDLV